MTHEGSLGSMESDMAVMLFTRSVEQYNLLHTKFVGDGDTNSFRKVFDTNVYDDYPVQKIECVGHVQKRVSTRLHNLVSCCGKRSLADGKIIGGRGRLTGDQIKAITQYYGSAIKDNLGDLKSMREAVWAIWFHKGSSDEHPMLNFCCTSWCPWKQAQTEGTLQTLQTHKQPVVSHHR